MTLQSGHDLRQMPTSARRERAAGGDRKFVSALARGLDILRAFTPTEGLLGNGELVQRTGLPKPTVTRLTYTLTKLGYLAYVERLGKYQLAPAALALGYSALANMRIRQIARGSMQALADYADASVALGTRDRLDIIYVEHCRSRHGVMLRLGLGSRIPIANTAMGRALIAGLPEAERDWLLGYMRREAGKGWSKLRAGIERAVDDVATRGFTVALGEWERDINAVGVPLIAPDGSGAFAFNCGAPAFQFTRERLESDIGPRLVNMVRNVEVDLSGR
jgi:DNA-binding IclR family transcriptional regulator